MLSRARPPTPAARGEGAGPSLTSPDFVTESLGEVHPVLGLIVRHSLHHHHLCFSFFLLDLLRFSGFIQGEKTEEMRVKLRKVEIITDQLNYTWFCYEA